MPVRNEAGYLRDFTRTYTNRIEDFINITTTSTTGNGYTWNWTYSTNGFTNRCGFVMGLASCDLPKDHGSSLHVDRHTLDKPFAFPRKHRFRPPVKTRG